MQIPSYPRYPLCYHMFWACFPYFFRPLNYKMLSVGSSCIKESESEPVHQDMIHKAIIHKWRFSSSSSDVKKAHKESRA